MYQLKTNKIIFWLLKKENTNIKNETTLVPKKKKKMVL
jgi:hypothetical protein